MACVMRSSARPSGHPSLTALKPRARAAAAQRGPAKVAVAPSCAYPQPSSAGGEDSALDLDRRAVLLGSSLLPLIPIGAACADSLSLVQVSDAADSFSIGVPEGWVSGTGEVPGGEGPIAAAGARRALAWFPEQEASAVNVTLVITNLSADFTSLGSFGTADAYGVNLVNSMDRSYLSRGPKWARKGVNEEEIQVAKLIDTASVNGGYQTEYTVSNSSLGKKHLISLTHLGYNGMYNRLYTLTAQCPEERISELKSTFKDICKSFKPPPASM